MRSGFAIGMCKLAGVIALPKVTRGFMPGGAKSGIGMKAPSAPSPSISTGTFKAAGGKVNASKSVPTASGKNLGNKVDKSSTIVPSVYGGTSQTSVR